MSGRRRNYGWNDDGSPLVFWSPIVSSDDGFEDDAIERVDRQTRMKGIVQSLTPAEQRVFVRYLLGYKCESPAERKALSRARKNVTKLLKKVL